MFVFASTYKKVVEGLRSETGRANHFHAAHKAKCVEIEELQTVKKMQMRIIEEQQAQIESLQMQIESLQHPTT